jgi:hypothetical protein
MRSGCFTAKCYQTHVKLLFGFFICPQAHIVRILVRVGEGTAFGGGGGGGSLDKEQPEDFDVQGRKQIVCLQWRCTALGGRTNLITFRAALSKDKDMMPIGKQTLIVQERTLSGERTYKQFSFAFWLIDRQRRPFFGFHHVLVLHDF